MTYKGVDMTGNSAYAAASATVLWGLTADQWTAIGVLVGIVFTVATFGINWYYKHKAQKNG